jgi:urease accessory protein UreF
MDMAQLIREQARLIVLQALEAQPDETLNSALLLVALARWGIRKERAWLHQELRWLAEMGAVRLVEVGSEAGSLLVASLAERGALHLARVAPIEGVQRPTRAGG